MTHHDFKPGDSVELIAAFKCQGYVDSHYEESLRQVFGDNNATGIVLKDDTYDDLVYVDYGKVGPLYTDPDVLRHYPPPATEEEIQTAIQSIQEALGGQS